MGATYTHAGKRYVLGYDATGYAIWDKDSLGSPQSSFPLLTRVGQQPGTPT